MSEKVCTKETADCSDALELIEKLLAVKHDCYDSKIGVYIDFARLAGNRNQGSGKDELPLAA